MVKEKRRSDPTSFFEPQLYQLPFFKCRAPERWIIGSNRIGKTTCGSVETIWRATGTHPYLEIPKATTGWVISINFKTQRDVLQPKFQEYFPQHRIANKSTREQDVWDRIILTCNRCGEKPRAQGGRRAAANASWWCSRCNLPCSIIGFKSCDQDVETFQGTSLDYAWFDEEPPKIYYTETKTRLIDRKGVLWGTMTPIKGQTWTYDDIVGIGEKRPEEIKVFTGTMYDNLKYLDVGYVKRFEASLDPAEAKIRVYGQYAIMSGLCFKGWVPMIHEVQELPQEFLKEDGTIKEYLDVYCGIDTGRFFAATFWLCDVSANLWGFSEYFGEDKPTSVHARALNAICRQWGISPQFTIDPRSQIVPDLGEHGIYCMKVVEEVEGRIQLMNTYMAASVEKAAGRDPGGPGMYVVTPTMPRWLWERRRYQWDKAAKTGPAAGAPKNAPVKKDDHAIDSSGYVFQLRPGPSQVITETFKTREREIFERAMAKFREREDQSDSDWED